MKTYKCLMSSTAGRKGSLIELNEQSYSTLQLIKKGLISELKVVTNSSIETKSIENVRPKHVAKKIVKTKGQKNV